MTLADEINRMIETALNSLEITSASPGHINNVIQITQTENPNLEDMIKDTAPQTPRTATTQQNPLAIIDSLSKEDAIGILGKAGISPKNITGMLKMSTSGVGLAGAGIGALSSVFPPALITLLILQMIPEIIKELSRPGGLMDKRVKIDARNEAVSVLDRQTRQNTRIGDRQVIIQQFEGFRNYDGYASTSTGELISKNADRVLDVGLFDRAQGMSSR
jgi:hypothetical protein